MAVSPLTSTVLGEIARRQELLHVRNVLQRKAAITNAVDGRGVDWMEHVTDAPVPELSQGA
jgi:hypothetical protein